MTAERKAMSDRLGLGPQRFSRPAPNEFAQDRRVFPCPNGWWVSAIPQRGGFWQAVVFDNLNGAHLDLTIGPDHSDLSASDVEALVDLACSMPVVA